MGGRREEGTDLEGDDTQNVGCRIWRAEDPARRLADYHVARTPGGPKASESKQVQL